MWLGVVSAVTGCAGQEAPLDNSAGTPMQAVAEQDLAASNAAGENLAGANLAGANLGGANLAGANLGGANLGGANLAGANLGGANLGGPNLGGANLGVNNTAVANELGDMLLVGNNLAGAAINTTLFNSALNGNSSTSTTKVACPLTGTYRLGTPSDAELKSSTSNIAKSIHTATFSTPSGLLNSAEELRTKTISGQSCIVLGLGSTALARLVKENGAFGMKVFAGFAKLPWKFRNPVDSTKELAAWEVVMWGPTSYSIFVLATPTTATYAGVGGFIKAAFRWAADPWTPIRIFAIGGEQPDRLLQIQTGMMGAYGPFVNGIISETTYVAGEIAFVAATTNNVSVKNVDFASWVRRIDGGILPLGNVSDSASPYWREGAFIAYHPDPNAYRTGFVSLVDKNMYIFAPPNVSTTVPSQWSLKLEYDKYKNGLRTKPVPKRCIGALTLNFYFREPIPAGKCDDMTTNAWAFFRDNAGSQYQVADRGTWHDYWSGVNMTPYNDEMRVATTLSYNFAGQPPITAGYTLSETYVHLIEQPWY